MTNAYISDAGVACPLCFTDDDNHSVDRGMLVWQMSSSFPTSVFQVQSTSMLGSFSVSTVVDHWQGLSWFIRGRTECGASFSHFFLQ